MHGVNMKVKLRRVIIIIIIIIIIVVVVVLIQCPKNFCGKLPLL